MPDRMWTPDQKNAIEARGGTLLVSAAAGSGKTAVLVQRIIDRITDPSDPVDADSLVVVTFTIAAAAEIKSRVQRGISERINADPSNRNLRRQQNLLQRADIGTMDSFCLKLIRENFHKLGLSPDFKIGDEQELSALRQTCMESAMEEFYRDDESGIFDSLSHLISTGRDDRALAETGLRLFAFARSHPFSKSWLNRILEMYDEEIPLGKSVWGKIILDYAASALGYAAGCLENALSQIKDDPKICDAYGGAFAANKKQIEAALILARSGDWDGTYGALHGINFQSLKPLRGYEDARKKERVTGLSKDAKEIVKKLAERQFCCKSADFPEDLHYLKERIEVLLRLVVRFWERYDEAKRERGLVDFPDIIEMAIRLLTRETPGGYEKTEDAQRLSRRFSEILIDEYQDTNEAQDMVFRAISKDETNLFIVGDVKQSIYRFRQAMPELFLEKKKSFSGYDGAHFPAKIDLDRNFRSKEAVTDFINRIFSFVMSEDLGEIDYAGRECLVPAARYLEPDAGGAEIDAVRVPEGEDKKAVEARFVGKRIRELIDSGCTVEEGGVLRPLRLGDICILLRAVKDKASVYERELSKAGIAAVAQGGGNLFETREVSCLLSLLRAVNNPMRDVPLTAALMSPFFGFSAEDIGAVRLSGKKPTLYASLLLAANNQEKAAAFVRELSDYRVFAAGNSAADLAEKIVSDHHYIPLLQTMSRPEMRIANLRLFLQMLRDREEKGSKRLSDVIRYIDLLEEKSAQPDTAPFSGGDAVRILSIHGSKGLEFPVCFVCDLAKSFNRQDVRARTLLHSRYGFSTVRLDEETRNQVTTAPHEALKLAIDRSAVSEEVRLLYVATTRARERLILTFGAPDPEKQIADADMAAEDGMIPKFLMQNASSFSRWLLYCAAANKSGPVRINIVEAGETKAPDSPAENAASLSPVSDEKIGREIRERIAFRYPYAALSEVPAKVSVSELVKPDHIQYAFRAKPKFLTGEELTATERGNAVHKVMQFADFAGLREDPRAEVSRLVEKKFLSEREGRAVRLEVIEQFLSSDAARVIFSCDELYREYAFITGLPASELSPGCGFSEKVMVQGVVDCICIKDGEATIIDYKTDRVSGGEELVGRYARQLEIYGRAVREILGYEIKEHLIYSFHLGKEFCF